MTNFKSIRQLLSKSFTLTLIILSIYGCGSTKTTVNIDELVKVSQPRVFTNTFKNGLYKTTMDIHDHELSGLMFFNKTDKSMRVVMLSEVGLKYFDIEYINDEQDPFVIHQLSELLNNEKFTYSIKNFLSLIMINPNKPADIYKVEENPGFLLREENIEGKKSSYYYNSNSGSISKINQSGSKKTEIILTEYDYLSPGEINYKQGKISYLLSKIEKD